MEHNWQRYLRYRGSKFEQDKFDYVIRFHTDFFGERLNKDGITIENFFTNGKKKLFVIDESHNLRNDKSQRYRFFVDEILMKNEDAKVLMLSATPINNTLLDIRNQFKLIVQGNTRGFEESLGIKNVDYTFRAAQKAFNEWREHDTPKIGEFIKLLPANFFKLTDNLTVARTRSMIEGMQTGLEFPKKEPPKKGHISENVFVTPSQIGNLESFEELFDHFPPMLSGYQPAYYTESIEEKRQKAKEKAERKRKGEKAVKDEILHDERQRQFFLVRMPYILMVKRLESSWFSCYSTVQKILAHHQN